MNPFEYEKNSMLVANLRAECDDAEQFPVLIGDEVAYFHEVDGGYSERLSADVVTLIHRVQGHGSPQRASHADTIEIHLDDYYQLSVNERRTVDEYPDRDYQVSLIVDSYMRGPYSFSEAMSADIDRRHGRYSHDEC